jgi:hypothetical protein
MAKKRKSASSSDAASPARSALPPDLNARLLAVWDQVGHLVEWCDTSTNWLQAFCNEARPFRETFYWEAIAKLVADYLAGHPDVKAERALTDCLIATQCPPLPDDRVVLIEFHQRWRALLASSRAAIDEVIQSDLELARQEGTVEAVSALYAADREQWLAD